MKIVVPKETYPGETRVPIVPASVKTLVALGAEVEVESGLGETCRSTDQDYKDAGATVNEDRKALISSGDLVLRLRQPPEEEVEWLKKGALHISYLDPFNQRALVETFASAGVSAISMEMVPRTTLAQKMDAISSQANLAGYVSVILAAERTDKILPMMMTPAGTIDPARVLICGVGVAGLQAIATANRMGARVEATDVRDETEEQVRSLGAKFVKVDLGKTESTKDGYAKELTEEQKKRQQEALGKLYSNYDVIITTAKVFGRPAPKIILGWMLEKMKPGTVIVDMAADTGGNVEGSKANEEVDVNGVNIIGFDNLPGMVAVPASEMYSSNLTHMITHFWDKEKNEFVPNPEDEIIQGCLLTRDGAVVNERVKSIWEKQ